MKWWTHEERLEFKTRFIWLFLRILLVLQWSFFLFICTDTKWFFYFFFAADSMMTYCCVINWKIIEIWIEKELQTVKKRWFWEREENFFGSFSRASARKETHKKWIWHLRISFFFFFLLFRLRNISLRVYSTKKKHKMRRVKKKVMDHFIHLRCVCVWNHLRRRPFFSLLDGRTFGFTSSDETLQTGGVDICQYPHLQHVNNIFVFSLRKSQKERRK